MEGAGGPAFKGCLVCCLIEKKTKNRDAFGFRLRVDLEGLIEKHY